MVTQGLEVALGFLNLPDESEKVVESLLERADAVHARAQVHEGGVDLLGIPARLRDGVHAIADRGPAVRDRQDRGNTQPGEVEGVRAGIVVTVDLHRAEPA